MNTELTRREYNAFLRQSLHPFLERCFYVLNPTTPFLGNWHIEVIAAALEDCLRGGITRLIICLPPRSLKSLCATAFTAYLLGKDPSTQIICASYSQELATNMHWTVARS